MVREYITVDGEKAKLEGQILVVSGRKYKLREVEWLSEIDFWEKQGMDVYLFEDKISQIEYPRSGIIDTSRRCNLEYEIDMIKQKVKGNVVLLRRDEYTVSGSALSATYSFRHKVYLIVVDLEKLEK
jgi:hypothetical protein